MCIKSFRIIYRIVFILKSGEFKSRSRSNHLYRTIISTARYYTVLAVVGLTHAIGVFACKAIEYPGPNIQGK